jgi:hypothetical protein
MKRTTIAIAVLATFAAAGSFAGAASAETELDRLHRVQRENRDIRRDNRDIRNDKRDLRQDKRDLARDRAERNYDQRREDRAIEHGNLKAAEKWDQRRRAEQRDINSDKRDIRRDERDLHRDRVDRNEDVRRRNRDASGL